MIAVSFTLGLFWFMNVLIRNDGIFEKPDRQNTYLNFVRIDPADDDINTKDRRLPEPPPPPEEMPETPDFSSQIDTVSSDLSMNMPTIGIPISDGKGPYLGTLTAGQGLAGFDTDVIPVVRVAPTYPRRAKQARIQGWVTMEVLIKPDGTVSNAKVMDSDPPRLFDEAAIVAMQRWKFRPKMVDGTPVPQRAKQTIEFKLE
ncbi:MAG: energy transducer TonB [Pseudomonadota bacterium]